MEDKPEVLLAHGASRVEESCFSYSIVLTRAQWFSEFIVHENHLEGL